MRLKPALRRLGTASLGAVVGVVIYVGYALPGVLPAPTGLFMFLIDTGIGHAAMKATSGKAGVLLAHVLRAFPFSAAFGVLAGSLLQRLSFPRLFCYSALAFPAISALSWWYFLLLDPKAPAAAPMLPAQMGELFWVFLWVYGWYFLALFMSYAIVTRLGVRKFA